jgi:hypothetical protein
LIVTPIPEIWRPSFFRFHPAVRRQLKSQAALRDLTIEEYLHQILCHELGLEDLEAEKVTPRIPRD